MQRRHFIASAASLPFSTTLLAAPSGGSRFLLVFLRGGYDAMSLLVPVASPFYYESRRNIAIPRDATLAVDAQWGLHPALATSVHPLMQRGQASFIPFAGTEDLSRSHFETQDSIELGQPVNARRDFQSGFLNRLAAQLQGRDAIAFTDQLPLVLRGPVAIANASLKNPPKAGNDAALRASLATMYRGHALETRVGEAFDVRDEVARQVAQEAMAGKAAEMEAASRNAVTAKGFELEARRMARLMRDRYALGFVDVGGWDTHVGQGAASGYLASRFEELGRGLAGYADEIGEAAWRDTVVVVLSEFGRTFRENGNRGTDHGHGSVHWVLGGALASGPVVGDQQALDTKARLLQDRDLPVLNDYRSVLRGLFRRQFALSDAALDQVFPGAATRDLGLV